MKKLCILFCFALTFGLCTLPIKLYPKGGKRGMDKRYVVNAFAKIGFGAFLINTQWQSWYYTVVKPYRRLIREFDDAPREESGPPSIAAKVFSTIGLAESALLIGDGVHDIWRLVAQDETEDEAKDDELSSI